jgi:signal peptidase II
MAIPVINNWRWLGLSLIVIGLDQLTKLVATSSLLMYKPVSVLPGVNFTLMYNPGAAFSFLSDASGWQRWFFTAIALVVSMIILVWLHRLPRHDKWSLVALPLILGGAIGNVIDRILFGHVIDFMDMYYKGTDCLPGFAAYLGECHWPAFNVADAAISISVILLIYDGLIGHRKHSVKHDA